MVSTARSGVRFLFDAWGGRGGEKKFKNTLHPEYIRIALYVYMKEFLSGSHQVRFAGRFRVLREDSMERNES